MPVGIQEEGLYGDGLIQVCPGLLQLTQLGEMKKKKDDREY